MNTLIGFRSRAQNQDSQSVYYEPHDLRPKPQMDYDWNSGLSFEKVASNTYDRRNSGSKHYTHVWKPVNTDVMILETPDVPRRDSSLNNQVPNNPSLSKKAEANQDYETPSCRC